MKIAVTGPHCSGKSTLLNRVETDLNLPNVRFVKFDGSSCPINYSNKSVINNRNDEVAITLWMISKLTSREIEIQYSLDHKPADVIIFDRCLLDQLVYPVVSLKEDISISIIRKYIDLWLSLSPYDLIFYVPKNEYFLKKVTNFNQDLDYLDKVEKTYLKLFDNLKHTDKVFILPPNQDEQKNIIIDSVNKILHKGG